MNDIGVWGFRHAREKHPSRVYNLGILEQSTTSIAAGLSLAGLIPIFYTIAPFMVERACEQLKDDFGYQIVNGNFVSVGASFDYSKLGTTHYCPADIGILLNIPNMEIVIPGTSEEFDRLFKTGYNDGLPTYYRLSEGQNAESYDVEFGKIKIVRKGKKATIIAVGNMLDKVMAAAEAYDVTVAYCTTVRPFDIDTILKVSDEKRFLICEPYYKSGILEELIEGYENESIKVSLVGIPRKVLSTYGRYEEIEKDCEMTVPSIRRKIEKLLCNQ